MDNLRIFAWAALAFLLFLNYQAWQKDYAPPPARSVTAPASSPAPREEKLPALPSESPSPSSEVPTVPSTPAPAPAPAVERAPTIRVVTDVLDMQISTRGGDLVRADLLNYPKVKGKAERVRLLTGDAPLFVVRSGLRAAGQTVEPTHLATFESAASEYRLDKGAEKLTVPLTWTDGQGVTLTKSYTFYPGSYRIDVTYDIANQSGKDWKAASYVQIVRHYEHIERSYFNVETYAYRGPEVYDGSKVRKLDVEDEEDRKYRGTFTGGWSAALQHHFVVAAVPPVTSPYEYDIGVNATNDFTLTTRGPLVTVSAGGSQSLKETVFVGPKLQQQLEATGPRLDLTADYGRLTIIAKPLFWVLDQVHSFVGNWGWAIVIVTFLIKLAFYKLTAASGRSMAKMRNLAPRIKAIQERYKDDRDQLGRQMMELYKREKINPLAGCLPILIQIPFFISFYWVLLESVEMRQAPFMGWITDLSSRDPYFILPAIMGAAMFAQFKLQPMPSADPIQAKIFMFMPLVMAGTMVLFPSGLVLYWLTNTLLSIAQQWRINKLVAQEAKNA
jgi:YidC/Oxa1 family membrane protein insertase